MVMAMPCSLPFMARLSACASSSEVSSLPRSSSAHSLYRGGILRTSSTSSLTSTRSRGSLPRTRLAYSAQPSWTHASFSFPTASTASFTLARVLRAVHLVDLHAAVGRYVDGNTRRVDPQTLEVVEIAHRVVEHVHHQVTE